MQFNSYTFIIFFAVVLLLHNLAFSWRLKKFNLLLASYLFYAAWNPPFVALLWISTIVDWLVAKQIYQTRNKLSKNLFLLCSLAVNLGFLGFFKYSDFLLSNFVPLLDLMGISFQPLVLDIILPVGISFYTFQTLSYTLDIYLGRMKPWNSLLDFAMFVTFFPQLVAGPIVRAADFLPQCTIFNRPSPRQVGWGLSLMLLGIFEKTVVADGILAGHVEHIYDSGASMSFASAWLGTFAFAGQIFCDFAGYSTTAIGAAMCLGFKLPDNFRFPYAAKGFSDFWRRWHISLSTWLRDYLYISLGGNRKGRVRTDINLLLTMLIGGLWHGASWTFIVWGGLHGLYLVVERLAKNLLGKLSFWSLKPVEGVLVILTFLLICITWVPFRADDFNTAFMLLYTMFGFGQQNPDITLSKLDTIIIIVTTGAICLSHWLLRNISLETAVDRAPQWLISLVLIAMACAIVMMPGEDHAFIYFQF